MLQSKAAQLIRISIITIYKTCNYLDCISLFNDKQFCLDEFLCKNKNKTKVVYNRGVEF